MDQFCSKSWFQNECRKAGSICSPMYGCVNSGGDKSGVRKCYKNGALFFRIPVPVAAKKNKKRGRFGPPIWWQKRSPQALKTGKLFSSLRPLRGHGVLAMGTVLVAKVQRDRQTAALVESG